MITPAFSTVACPDWTLDQVAPAAARWGYTAVELRTFGDGSRQFACDPALTAPEKIRRMFGELGVHIASIATGCSFDEPVFPPVIGNVISDTEKAVRAARRAIDLAGSLECPLVRVFGFQLSASERRVDAIERIAGRLNKVADHADRTGVRVMLEMAGSFARAADALEVLDRANHPLLGVCFNSAESAAAGEEPEAAINAVGRSLMALRLSDWSAGRPVRLGTGTVPCRRAVAAARAAGFRGPAIIEWDRAWLGGLEPIDAVLPEAIKTLVGWSAAASPRAAAGVA